MDALSGNVVALPGAENIVRIIQKNQEKRILILNVGSAAAQLLKSGTEELHLKEINAIFPHRIMETVVEDVTFESDGEDISEVLRKIRRMTIIDAEGQEKPVILKILPDDVDGTDIIYSMLIRPEAVEQSRSDKKILARQMAVKGYEKLDSQTGMPEATTFTKDMEMVHHIVRRDNAEAVVAVIAVGAVDPKIDAAILTKVGQACRLTFRVEDTVARIGYMMFGVILMDAHMQGSLIAFQRLRTMLGGQHVVLPDGTTITPQIAIAYGDVRAMEQAEKMLSLCDKAAKTLAPGQGAAIVELRSLK